MVEFLNLLQEGMSFHDYPFKFTKLLKYSPSLVSDPRDEMSHFVTEMLDDFQEECHSVMLHDKMNISRLMVHALNMEEARDKRKSRDGKSVRYFDGGSSKNKLEIQENPTFKMWVSNHVPSKFPKVHDDKMYNPKPKKGRSNNSPTKKLTCGNCGKKHYGDCLIGTNN